MRVEGRALVRLLAGVPIWACAAASETRTFMVAVGFPTQYVNNIDVLEANSGFKTINAEKNRCNNNRFNISDISDGTSVSSKGHSLVLGCAAVCRRRACDSNFRRNFDDQALQWKALHNMCLRQCDVNGMNVPTRSVAQWTFSVDNRAWSGWQFSAVKPADAHDVDVLETDAIPAAVECPTVELSALNAYGWS